MTNEKQKLIAKIKLINAGDDLERIKDVLYQTDNNILKHIRTVTVHDNFYVPYKNKRNVAGTACNFGEGEYSYGNINIISSRYCRSFNIDKEFKHTLNHEIGHVAGNTINRYLCDSEDFAEKYANNQYANNQYANNQNENSIFIFCTFILCAVTLIFIFYFLIIN